MMINRILAITLISCFLFGSCDLFKEQETKDEEAKRIADYTTNFLVKGLNWETCCTVNTVLAKGIDDYEEKKIILAYIPELFDHRTESDWKTVDKLLTNKLDHIITPNLSENHRLATASIQYTVLYFVNRYLLVEVPSKEIALAIQRYLNILVRHQAVDLSIMADGLLHSKDFMDKSTYSSIREYIYATAIEREEFAKNHFAIYDAAIKNAPDARQVDSEYINAKALENKLLEAAYVKRILAE